MLLSGDGELEWFVIKFLLDISTFCLAGKSLCSDAANGAPLSLTKPFPESTQPHAFGITISSFTYSVADYGRL